MLFLPRFGRIWSYLVKSTRKQFVNLPSGTSHLSNILGILSRGSVSEGRVPRVPKPGFGLTRFDPVRLAPSLDSGRPRPQQYSPCKPLRIYLRVSAAFNGRARQSSARRSADLNIGPWSFSGRLELHSKFRTQMLHTRRQISRLTTKSQNKLRVNEANPNLS
jgi:hypothetical protein